MTKHVIIFIISSLFFSFSFANNFPFKQVGYFKDGKKNRIYTFKLEAAISQRQILEFSRFKPNTPGQLTSIYYYSANANPPADEVTFAKNVFTANEVISNSSDPWQFVYITYINGNDELINCNQTPSHLLCIRYAN